MSLFKKFFVALKVFTTLPVPVKDFCEEDVERTTPYLTNVGMLIGLCIYIFTLIMAFIAIKTGFAATTVVALMLLIFWYAVTGTIHLDGLVGTFSKLSKCCCIKNNEDPINSNNINTGGIFAIIIVLLIKLSCLVLIFEYLQLTGTIKILIFLTLIPVLSRFSAVTALCFYTYNGDTGFVQRLKETTKNPNDLILAFIPLLLSFVLHYSVLFEIKILLLITTICYIMGLILSFCVPFVLNNLLEGLDGKSYGASIELVEAGTLLLLVFSFMTAF